MTQEEGLNLESKGRTVFITRTGIRYHRGDADTSEKARSQGMEDAENEGYTPCKCASLQGRQRIRMI